MHIETASVDSLILYFDERICEEILDKVQHAYHALKKLPHIINLTPSYHSILIEYDIFKHDTSSLKHIIEETLASEAGLDAHRQGKLIEIPVDYTKGLDIGRIAQLHNLTPANVIAKHIAQTYRVYAIGFMVGFAYLAKVDDAIATPRLNTPRKNVPKGSVAIAETQTAVYPQESPGGWNIIGHTEFDDYASFEIGDSVRFIAL